MREELVALENRIAESAAHLDAALHRLLVDLRAFDDAQGWFEQGFQSCAHWLSWRVGWDLATARERVRVAQRLAELPQLAAALEKAEVSYSKVRAMARVATVENQELLLDYARAATAAQLETICRKYQTIQEVTSKDPDVEAARRRVTRRVLDDGMVRIDALLRPEEAALVWAAIERATGDDSAETPNRADGLVALAKDYASGGDRTPLEVVVTVPRATLAGVSDEPGAVADGTFVSAEASRRLACDAGLVEMVEGPAGEVLSVGARTRAIPVPIKRALRRRDETCRFPGCSNRRFVEGHHVRHWADGGETRLSNLVLTCSYHHIFLHEHGYRVELDADQQPRFFAAAGRPVEASRSRPDRLGWATIEAENAHLGIEASTGPSWDGRPVDYHAAIDGLVALDSEPTRPGPAR